MAGPIDANNFEAILDGRRKDIEVAAAMPDRMQTDDGRTASLARHPQANSVDLDSERPSGNPCFDSSHCLMGIPRHVIQISHCQIEAREATLDALMA